MANFDIAMGLNQACINSISQAFYNKGRERIFKGTIQAMGMDIGWQAKSAPVVKLKQPSLPAAKRIADRCDLGLHHPHLLPHLPRMKGPNPRHHIAKIIADVNNNNLFALTIEQFELSFGDVAPVTVPLNARCSITSTTDSAKLHLLSLSITVEGAANQNLVNNYVVPAMKRTVSAAFEGIRIPNISLPGVGRIGSIGANVQQERINVLGNLAHTHPSSAGFNFPSSPFYALVSQEVLQAEVSHAINGRTYGPSGSVGIAIGTVDYHANVSIHNPSVTLDGTRLKVSMSLSGSAGAGISIGCSHPSIRFNINVEPQPTVTCALELNGHQLSVRGLSVSKFAVLVTPSGGVSGVLSPFVSPIASAIASAIAASFGSDIISGLTFGSFNIPNVPIDYDGVSLIVSGDNLNLANRGNHLTIEGDVRTA